MTDTPIDLDALEALIAVTRDVSDCPEHGRAFLRTCPACAAMDASCDEQARAQGAVLRVTEGPIVRLRAPTLGALLARLRAAEAERDALRRVYAATERWAGRRPLLPPEERAAREKAEAQVGAMRSMIERLEACEVAFRADRDSAWVDAFNAAYDDARALLRESDAGSALLADLARLRAIETAAQEYARSLSGADMDWLLMALDRKAGS